MAESKQKPKGTSFVSEIVKDPAESVDLLLLRGFLGASAETDHKRLYGDATLGTYVEIPDAAIRHVQELSPDASAPFGGAYVWVDRDAELVHGPVAEPNPEETTHQSQEGTKMYTVPPYCPPAAGQAAIPTIPASQCLTVPIVCCPLPAGQGYGAQQAYGAQGQAAIPTVPCPTVPPFCGLPTLTPPTCLPPLCGGAQASQAAGQAAIPTIPASQCLTVPIVCCPLPAGQGQGYGAQQAHGAQGQAAVPTVPPFCGLPTVIPPTCWPPLCGGAQATQATGQAAFPTIPASQCVSVPIVCC